MSGHITNIHFQESSTSSTLHNSSSLVSDSISIPCVWGHILKDINVDTTKQNLHKDLKKGYLRIERRIRFYEMEICSSHKLGRQGILKKERDVQKFINSNLNSVFSSEYGHRLSLSGVSQHLKGIFCCDLVLIVFLQEKEYGICNEF